MRFDPLSRSYSFLHILQLNVKKQAKVIFLVPFRFGFDYKVIIQYKIAKKDTYIDKSHAKFDKTKR